MKKPLLSVIEFTGTSFSFLQGGGTPSVDEITYFFPEQGSDIPPDYAAITKARQFQGELPLCALLPRRIFILKSLRLPSHDEVEIRDMVALQLQDHIPYKENEAIWQTMITERMPDQHSRVLLMAVQSDTVERYLGILSKYKLFPSVVTMSSFGLAGWLASSRCTDVSETTLLIRLEASFTELCCCDHKRLYFSRQVDVGTDDIEKSSFSNLLDEIKLTIASYKEDAMGPQLKSCVVLSMMPSIANKIIEPLQELLLMKIKLVDVITPASLNRSKVEVRSALAARSVTMAASLGVLKTELKELPNFLPAPLKAKMAQRIFFRQQFKLLALILIAGISLFFALNIKTITKTRTLSTIQALIDEQAPEVSRIKARAREIEALRREMTLRVPVVVVLDEIYQLIPIGIALTNFHMDDAGELSIQGQTLDGADVGIFQGNLINSSLFEKVTLQHATKRVTAFGEATQFSLIVNLKPRLTKE